MDTFFQVGMLSAFLEGVFESNFTFEKLVKSGDFGLGVLNNLDGELVAVDGDFFRMDENGNANKVKPTDTTPFAIVSHFKAKKSFNIENIATLDDLNQVLEVALESKNIFHMIRIEAELKRIKLRSECCKKKTTAPLAEVLPNIQNNFELSPSQGTLVATCAPTYSQNITIPGFHYHYVNKDRKMGGHVFNLELTKAKVMIQPLRHFEMTLSDTTYFDKITCNPDIESALRKVE